MKNTVSHYDSFPFLGTSSRNIIVLMVLVFLPFNLSEIILVFPLVSHDYGTSASKHRCSLMFSFYSFYFL